MVPVNLQMRINTVHRVVRLLLYLPCHQKRHLAPVLMRLPPSVRAFLQFHMLVAVLTPKREISDRFHISAVISIIYFFSNFKHEICKENMNQKNTWKHVQKKYVVSNRRESAGAGWGACKQWSIPAAPDLRRRPGQSRAGWHRV